METIFIDDSATALIDKCNENFGNVIVQDRSATETVAAINNAFGETAGAELLSADDSATEFVEKLNKNFGLYDGDAPSHNIFRFLHFSDPHGYASAAAVCKEMMGDDSSIKFTILTGDVSQYSSNSLTDVLSAEMSAMSGKLLVLAGNHDVYDMSYGGNSASQQTTTNYIKAYNDANVSYGDSAGVASYWYKDFPVGSGKLRIIAIDQYERDKVRNPGAYKTMYSQQQVNWFLGLLDGLGADDYLIIATHEAPLKSATVPDPYVYGDPGQNIEGMRATSPFKAEKLFMSEYVRAFGNQCDDNLLPRIMNAYLNNEHLQMEYTNHGGTGVDISIDKDFTNAQTCTFLFYIGGHQHCDFTYYLPDESDIQDVGGDFSMQLMNYIAAADKRVGYSTRDDLGGGGSEASPTPTNPDGYRINDISLDFTDKTITIKRIGDKNTAAGRVREQITFPFTRES